MGATLFSDMIPPCDMGGYGYCKIKIPIGEWGFLTNTFMEHHQHATDVMTGTVAIENRRCFNIAETHDRKCGVHCERHVVSLPSIIVHRTHHGLLDAN
jgi:hypothetical protein